MRSLLLVCLVLTAAVGAAAAASQQRAVVACGRVTYVPYGTTKTVAYAVKVVSGRVPCATARRVLTAFIRNDVSPRGWLCFRGHRSQNQNWAASCATAAGALVRAYGPVRP